MWPSVVTPCPAAWTTSKLNCNVTTDETHRTRVPFRLAKNICMMMPSTAYFANRPACGWTNALRCRMIKSCTRAEPADERIYLGSDGRRKASLESAANDFHFDAEHSPTIDSDDKEAWRFSWQLAERNLPWNNRLIGLLIKRIAASELSCSAEELEERLMVILSVLPMLSERVHTMKPEIITKLCAKPERVAEQLVELKTIFPSANVQEMVLRQSELLLSDLSDISAAVQQLHSYLPKGVDVDRLCQQYPSILDVASFKAAVDEAKRLIPSLDLVTALNANPEFIFSVQRGKSMIPYDAVPDTAMSGLQPGQSQTGKVVQESHDGQHVMREKGVLEKVSQAIGLGSVPDKARVSEDETAPSAGHAGAKGKTSGTHSEPRL